MTKRDEIIEAIQTAHEKHWRETPRFIAAAAFDAALLAMMEPSEEMVRAADEVIGTINPIDAFTLALATLQASQ